MSYDSRVWDWASGACLNHKGQELPCQVCIKTRDMDLFRPDIIEAAKAAFNDGVGYVISEATIAEMEILNAWQLEQAKNTPRRPAECRVYRPGTSYIKLPSDEEVLKNLQHQMDLAAKNPCAEIPLGGFEMGTEFKVNKVLDGCVCWLLGKSSIHAFTEDEKNEIETWCLAREQEGSTFGCQDPTPDAARLEEWSRSDNPVQRAKAAYILGTAQPTLTPSQTTAVDLWIHRRVKALCEIGQGDEGTVMISLSEIEPTLNLRRPNRLIETIMKHGAGYAAVVLESLKDGLYNIKDGKDRVAAARSLGWTQIKARIIGRRE